MKFPTGGEATDNRNKFDSPLLQSASVKLNWCDSNTDSYSLDERRMLGYHYALGVLYPGHFFQEGIV